jgi:hypothetical protein
MGREDEGESVVEAGLFSAKLRCRAIAGLNVELEVKNVASGFAIGDLERNSLRTPDRRIYFTS